MELLDVPKVGDDALGSGDVRENGRYMYFSLVLFSKARSCANRIGGPKEGDFRSKTKSCILTQSKKCRVDPNVFDRPIRSAHPVAKAGVFQRDARIGLLDQRRC